MSTFFTAVQNNLAESEHVAAEILTRAELLEEFAAAVMEELDFPATLYASEAGAIHENQDGGFLLLDAGHYDTSTDDLAIRNFDPIQRVKEALNTIQNGWDEE